MVSEVGSELQKIQFRLRSTRLIQEITYAAASSTSDNLCHSHLWPIWSTLTRVFQFFCILSRGTHMSLVPLVPLIDFPYQYSLPILFSLSLALITSKKFFFIPTLSQFTPITGISYISSYTDQIVFEKTSSRGGGYVVFTHYLK